MWWYIRIGRFAGPGHGVPGTHEGVGETVGEGVADAVGVGGRIVGVGDSDGVGVGKGAAPSLPLQAMSSPAAKTHITRADAYRARRVLRSATRRLAARMGVVRRRKNIAGTLEAGMLVILRDNA
jgi:hypothetical protein